MSTMINSVRNTVLSVLNKNNYGYISPSDFNLYAKQAQLDIFEDYFYDFNYQINKENARTSGTDYANIKQQIGEVIDTFSLQGTLVYAAPYFTLPTDWYTLYRVDIVNAGVYTSIERVSLAKINKLLMSNLTAPNTTFPVYTIGPSTPVPPPAPQAAITNSIQVFPDTIVANVVLTYIRYPKDPRWTYITLASGEPVFSDTATDYQDFELPKSDAPTLINKILEYAGVSIRELEVYKIAATEEQLKTQEED